MQNNFHRPITERLSFLTPKFLEAMNEIGRYGHEKYGAESFHTRALSGDTSRSLERTQSAVVAEHALDHFLAYLNGVPHDHFGTRRHQLAAVAFNAMMEFHFAGLEDEAQEIYASCKDSGLSEAESQGTAWPEGEQ